MYFDDDDLQGLTPSMKSMFASSLGKAAVWRKGKYKVPLNYPSVCRLLSYCQNASTRENVFETYYSGFDAKVNSAALDLLRTRKDLAGRLGFSTWAEYQLRPLAVEQPSTGSGVDGQVLARREEQSRSKLEAHGKHWRVARRKG